jgi:four helix bundle protein
MRISGRSEVAQQRITSQALKRRSRDFAVSVLRAASDMPATVEGRVVRTQLIRAATSVGANYRAACRARSAREFTAKLGHVEEEADEVMYWIEIAVESGLADRLTWRPIWREANELLSIFIASIRTSRRSHPKPKSAIRNPQSAISAPTQRRPNHA